MQGVNTLIGGGPYADGVTRTGAEEHYMEHHGYDATNVHVGALVLSAAVFIFILRMSGFRAMVAVGRG